MNIQRVKPFEEDLDNDITFNSLNKHYFSPLSQTLILRVLYPNKPQVSNHKHSNMRDNFSPICFFPHWAHADSSFVGGSDVSRLERYCTNVLLARLPRSDARRVTLTFSRCQRWGSDDTPTWRGHHLIQHEVLNKKRYHRIGISATILNHMDRN